LRTIESDKQQIHTGVERLDNGRADRSAQPGTHLPTRGQSRTARTLAEVGRIIQRLKEDGQSIALVEQNIQSALGVAEQAIILNTGRCVFAGTTRDILNNDELINQNLGTVHAH
jgi:hypothetical protein